MKRLTARLVLIVGASLAGSAQTLLTVEVKNYVPYHIDVPDPATFASNPGITPGTPRVFQRFVFIGDIVSVNGQPAKGIWTATVVTLQTSLTPTAKQAIADGVRNNIIEMYFDLMQADGTPIGTIMTSGLTRGSPAPGAPLVQTGDSIAIVGGTGAFLGLRGQAGMIDAGSPRQASAVEDPANRRINGGANRSYVLHVIPMLRPEVAITSNGPAVTHSGDFSLVTASKPAAPGEILSLFATGLGPTKSGVDPGQPFPSKALAVVNSPLQVTVSGKPAEVLGAVGYPGSVDSYQVNFRLPADTPKGTASIQVIAAWIAGPPVSITVQ
jgi:uncharacterized protein (TIGR03437 family)